MTVLFRSSVRFCPYHKPPESDTDFADKVEKGGATKLNLWLFSFVTRDLVMVFLVKAGPTWVLLVVPKLFFESSLKRCEKDNTILCAFAVIITCETQKCRKKMLCFFEFKSVTNHDRQKRFSQNGRRRDDLQKVANSWPVAPRSYIFAMAVVWDDRWKCDPELRSLCLGLVMYWDFGR